jgi:type II secretory pathway component PulJ
MKRLKGMSLIEMLIAIAIMIMGMGGFTYLFLNSWQSNKYIIEMGNASVLASRGVNAIVAELRKVRQADNGDYPIESGDKFDLKVYLDIDNDGVTERVHYYLLNGVLYRGVTNPVAGLPVTYPNGDGTTNIIAKSVINTNANPVFYYYNDDYPSDTVNNPLTAPVDVADVRMIRVHLMVNIDPLHVPDHINIQSFAELRNLNNY